MDYIVFNELSIPFKDRFKIDDGIKLFLQTFAAASNLGINQLRLHQKIGENLYSLELAPGYSLSKWLHTKRMYNENDPGRHIQPDDDSQTRFKEIITSTPLITDDEPIEKEENERSSFEISISGKIQEADGLGAAYLLDTLTISFLSDILLWDRDEIKDVKHIFLDENGFVQENFVTVRHVSRSIHIETHSRWLEKKRQESLKRSIDLWERRQEFFPHLILCERIRSQLTTHFGLNSRYFNQLMDRLKKLDTFARNWTSGGFSQKELRKFGLIVSGESTQTMSRYEDTRRFRLPDGRKEIFDMHIKSGDLRFHFFPDENSHRVYVGYIGPHLPIFSGK